MPQHATVHVELSHASYDILIDSSGLDSSGPATGDSGSAGSSQAFANAATLATAFDALTPLTHLIIITDSSVRQTHAQSLVEKSRSYVDRVDVIEVPSGESSKCVEQLNRLWCELLSLGADRKTAVAAVGGGVVGDLAGFVAASFGRGVRFIQVPTTLLAFVDSSVGGKVGINLPGAKNMVGAFWQPACVLIDTATLATLPRREYLSGFAEVVKYGVIMDEPFFELLEKSTEEILARDPSTLRRIVARCCELKAEVVQEDETESTGRRAILNYGHTYAHGFEAVGGYGALLHGEAVSIGMVCASRLAESRGMVPPGFTRRQVDLLEALELPTKTPDYDRQELIDAMARDKKAAHGKLRFILPEGGMGKMVFVSDVPNEEVVRSLDG